MKGVNWYCSHTLTYYYNNFNYICKGEYAPVSVTLVLALIECHMTVELSIYSNLHSTCELTVLKVYSLCKMNLSIGIIIYMKHHAEIKRNGYYYLIEYYMICTVNLSDLHINNS